MQMKQAALPDPCSYQGMLCIVFLILCMYHLGRQCSVPEIFSALRLQLCRHHHAHAPICSCRNLLTVCFCALRRACACSYVPDTLDMNTTVQQRKTSSCC
jgi:hypothetical protein